MKHRRCLLIGNSRWHWAEHASNRWTFHHTPPDPSAVGLSAPHIEAWAAVGVLPANSALDPRRRLKSADVPLRCLPPWLGVDRAFAAWGALQQQQASGSCRQGLLVADAGTVLSLTRVMADGGFAGGQLVPGLRLQLQAMSEGALLLSDPGPILKQLEFFPLSTAAAMQQGALQALIGVIEQAQRQADQPLWLCGGDGPVLSEPLRQRGVPFSHSPELVLQGMVNVLERLS